MTTPISNTVQALLKRGVQMPDPAQVYVDGEVDPERIAPGAVLSPGTRLLGATTSIGAGTIIGGETPATLQDCGCGRNVKLAGGFFHGAVFLDGASMGSGAHVRPGTLVEEQAGGAHSVGFKQTILLPYVTAGSLINFCDLLMAGGTSRKHHSEVGSSYIHFNFTPHGDKATASLFGDVPRGVMLDRAPIFLGGQGGTVGPCRVAYGTVAAAGTIVRRDVLEEGQLVRGGASPGWKTSAYTPGGYTRVGRLVENNLLYIGNLVALREWYRLVRLTSATDAYTRMALEQAVNLLNGAVAERVRQLDRVMEKVKDDSGEEAQRALAQWPARKARFAEEQVPESVGREYRAQFVSAWAADPQGDYLDRIHGLSPERKQWGVHWLQAVVDWAAE